MKNLRWFLAISLISFNVQASLKMLDDASSFMTKGNINFAFANESVVKQITRFPFQENIISDHEWFIFKHEENGTLINVLTANILGLQRKIERKELYNNGFMTAYESDYQYRNRLQRIVNRLSAAHQTHKLQVINLQDAPAYGSVYANFFKNLCRTHLPDFAFHHSGHNIMLVYGSDMTLTYEEANVYEPFAHMLINLSNVLNAPNMMAIYFFNLKLIVVNVHAQTLPLVSEAYLEGEQWIVKKDSPIIREFNELLYYLSIRYQGQKIIFAGDFNRENKKLPDQRLTLDIESFASALNMVDMKTYLPSFYTKITTYSGNPGIATSSDYVIVGRLRGAKL